MARDHIPESSRTNPDDVSCVARPAEGGDGVVEGRDVADARPQSSVTHPPHDLTQLGHRLDNEIDRRPSAGRARSVRRRTPFLRVEPDLRTASWRRRR